MVKVLHCPNPLCTNTFSAAEVQEAGVVKCPRCGQEFRFKPPDPSSIPVGKPANALVDKHAATARLPANPANEPRMMPAIPKPRPKPAAPPQATPVVYPSAPPPAAYTPLALPVGDTSQPAAALAAPNSNIAAKPQKIVHVRGLKATRPRSSLAKVAVVAFVIGLFLTAACIVIYTLDPWLRSNGNLGHAPGIAFHVRTQRGVEEKVLTLHLDKSRWAPDKETKSRLKALAAFKKADAETDLWIAVAVQDFGFRNPREGELLSGAIDRLRSQFGDSLQCDTKLEPATLGGIEASCCPFEGRVNVVVWRGACYLVPHHGFAYWIFIASPIDGRAQQQFAEFDEQKAIALTTERRGWTESPPEIDIFTAQGNTFSVQTPRAVWRKNDPKTEDENGVIYLSGFFQSLPNQGGEFVTAKNATIVAVALDKNPDLGAAFKNVAAYFEKKKQEESKDYRLERISEHPALNAEIGEVGVLAGVMGEFKLKRGDESMRYIVLATFNDDVKSFGLRCECAWDHRTIWRSEFQDLLKTVKLGQK